MKTVQAADRKWLANQLRHRKGNILIKDMLEGEDGSPENYKFFLSKESADFYSPRHRHPWDQIRFCLEGSVPIGVRKSVDEGEIGYFPEGVHYGPQDGDDRFVAILQFGGASGQGILSSGQVNRGYDLLSGEGTFDGGIFRRKTTSGKRNQDGYEAIWQKITGQKMINPPPRYKEPVVMNPGHFAWRPVAGGAGVEQRHIGSFSERATKIDFFRLARGARRALPPEDHLRLLYVVKGTGACGRQPYRRHTSMELAPGEAARFMPKTATEILSITIPSVVALGLKAA
ncbi:MAG: hypothetical protein HOM58_22415 [Rhodospirillaceae bacterium]|nr:hypothetical protein [Rhodospirillaceae bacterium]MBT5458720.1 hypothetical protein [Rhodospirillaceae bacterium]